MCLEYNAYGNAARARTLRAELAKRGDALTIWFTRNQPGVDIPFTAAAVRQAMIESEAIGFVAEAEIPGHRPEAQNWVELEAALHDLPIWKAVATNFSPFTHADGIPDRPKAKVLIKGGWKLITEVYAPEHCGITAEKRHAFAQHYTYDAIEHLPEDHPDHGMFEEGEGWYETQPVVGTYSGVCGNFELADYPTLPTYRNWSVWAAEYEV